MTQARHRASAKYLTLFFKRHKKEAASMGVGGFLKKLGLDVVQAAAATNNPAISVGEKIVESFLPAKTAAVVKSGFSDLTLIASEIQSVEAVAASFAMPVPGPQKLQAAVPGVQQIVNQWLASTGLGESKVKDPTTFQRGVQELTSGVADILSAIELPAASALPNEPAPTTNVVPIATPTPSS